MESNARVFVAGDRTSVGNAIHRSVTSAGFSVVGAGREQPDFAERLSVDRFFEQTRPDYVFVVAGRSAGIGGNQRLPADLMIDNLLVAAHVIPAAQRYSVRKLLYLASSCTYPKLAPQPLQVSSLWTGPLEPTSAAYAVAKLAGIKMCEAYRRQHGARFITAISGDAYGPHDDFSLEDSHVVGALIRRMHEAREAGAPSIEVWGSGTPRREFIYVDDVADACLFVMRRYEDPDPINLGTGRNVSIAELANAVKSVVGYRGEVQFDRTKPDGMPFKGLDSSPLNAMGWRPQWDLRRGLESTYRWFVAHATSAAT